MKGMDRTTPAPEHIDGTTRLKRAGLLAATALVSINIWTGSPLLAVWVGSKVQGSFAAPKMEAVGAVIGVLALLLFASTWVLSWLNAKYDSVAGRPAPRRRTYPWMESMRSERHAQVRREIGVSAVEKVVVASVVAAVLAIEIWFFFFAGSSLPNS